MTTPSGTVLTVGTGQQFSSLSAAIAASQDGDTIALQAGTYYDDPATVTHSVTIEGVGGMAHLVSTQDISNDKAILIDDAANLTIQNLEFSGATVSDGNGAGIRYEAGNLQIIDSYFHDNQDGILGGRVAGGNVTITGSTFVHNGAGDGQTHGAYLGEINSFTVTNSFFQDQLGGSDIKSRAATTEVANNQLVDTANGDTNYQVDLPNGGNATVENNLVVKSGTPENRAIVHFGGEISNPTGALVVQGNQFYSHYGDTSAVLNQTNLPVSLLNNGLSADVTIPVDQGTATATISGNVPLHGADPSTALELPGGIAAPGLDHGGAPEYSFDPVYYLNANPDVAASGVDPQTQYDTVGWMQGRNPNALFDTSWYLQQNPDVAAAGIDPLLHYELYGWKEGRDPSPNFSDSGYLAANPDVKLAGMNPLDHYTLYGMSEGRAA
jgi:hypothetical protein